ncbi:YodL domain-containing protein [Enterocloster aldenensis]|uniref:YodL domain-containing protein n=1 Tax=Enterocloster aldenensis TaxID=358742 RepID=UPI004024A801
MAGIAVKDNVIHYYGNMAGYVEDGTAVVDPMFRNESLARFLKERKGLDLSWQEGVYDHLSNGTVGLTGEVKPIKSCRLHQLRAEVPPEERFLDFEEQVARYGQPDRSRYEAVYDCQLGTNDLEAVYEKFEREFPQESQGHPISISDVIELYDQKGSEYYYIDHYGFQKIAFTQGQSLEGGEPVRLKGEDICQGQPI